MTGGRRRVEWCCERLEHPRETATVMTSPRWRPATAETTARGADRTGGRVQVPGVSESVERRP